jgi:hypothetical protein
MIVIKENVQLMGQKSGIEVSLTDDDIINYLNHVLNEVKQKREDRYLGRGFKSTTRSISFYEGTAALN